MHAMTADDRVLTTLPLFHVGGLNIQTTPALRAGCTVTLHAKFDADATFDAIERERITLTVLVPAQLEAMMAHPRWAEADFSQPAHDQHRLDAGARAADPRRARARRAAGPGLGRDRDRADRRLPARRRSAAQGRHAPGAPPRGCELRIVDVDGHDVPPGASGEVLVRGRNVMSGYWRDPQATAQRRWPAAGSTRATSATSTTKAILTIDGRLKDMIISGGENISPAEIEGVLLDCPDIAEAAVVGRPDARWGEVVVAVVAPQARRRRSTRERVLALFDGRLARFKHPKDVLVVDALPRTALGKVRKEDVRQLVAPAWRRPTDQEQRMTPNAAQRASRLA